MSQKGETLSSFVSRYLGSGKNIPKPLPRAAVAYDKYRREKKKA